MPDFSADFWIREPVIDGETALNRAMALLDQCRDEIEAIETALGTDPAGNQTDLLTRLSKRVSKSGILRGAVHAYRGPNNDPTSLFSVTNWRQGGSTYVQFGIDGLFSVASPSVTFGRSYFSALGPNIVIAQWVNRDLTINPLGDIQVHRDTIDETGFECDAFQFTDAGGLGTWAAAGSANFYIGYIALGGFPS